MNQKNCQRCGSNLNYAGFCRDQTCPFSNHKQHCWLVWTGHPEHPKVGDNTECRCDRCKVCSLSG